MGAPNDRAAHVLCAQHAQHALQAARRLVARVLAAGGPHAEPDARGHAHALNEHVERNELRKYRQAAQRARVRHEDVA